MSSKDNLGDRIKDYEAAETQRKFMKGLPIVVRLDGRSFSKYTKNFNRPFDEDMSEAMFETTKFLVEQTNALIGYTQSDEITLILHAEDPKSEILFGGKVFKIVSNLASLASVRFYDKIREFKGENAPRKLPSFDCRAFQVPTKIEAWNALLWRVQDAVRNSVQQLGQANFSHKELQRKNVRQIKEMLESNGIVWGNLPSKYKEGRFVRSEKIMRPVDMKEYTIQAPKTNGLYQPEMVERSVMSEVIMDKKFNIISNRVEFIFDKAAPQFVDTV